MTDGRSPKSVCEAFLYLLEDALEDEEVQKFGITVVHDASNISPSKNLNKEIPKMMIPSCLIPFR